MKVLINGEDLPCSAPSGDTTGLANQNAALMAENLRLSRENMLMRMRQSQGFPPMSSAPPGIWAPLRVVPDISSYQQGYQHDTGFNQKGGHSQSSLTFAKGKGAKMNKSTRAPAARALCW